MAGVAAPAFVEHKITQRPVVMFSKSYCPESKKIKKLLKDEYKLSSSQFVAVDIERRQDVNQIEDYFMISCLSDRRELPQLWVDGQYLGNEFRVMHLHDENQLAGVFKSAGISVPDGMVNTSPKQAAPPPKPVETPKPTTKAPKPTAEAAKPADETPRPVEGSSKPAEEISRPDEKTVEPTNPAPQTDQTNKPEKDAPEAAKPSDTEEEKAAVNTEEDKNVCSANTNAADTTAESQPATDSTQAQSTQDTVEETATEKQPADTTTEVDKPAEG